MSTTITQADIVAGVAESQRSMLVISSADLPAVCSPVVEAFWEAVRCFVPAVRPGRIAHVLFATAPFQVNLQNGTLNFTPNEGVINVAIEHLIFLDVGKMLPYPREIQVACIIEEFVHAIMHIADEELTSHVVVQLYPKVALIEGKYTVAEAGQR